MTSSESSPRLSESGAKFLPTGGQDKNGNRVGKHFLDLQGTLEVNFQNDVGPLGNPALQLLFWMSRKR